MSAICGVLHLDGAPAPPHQLRQMMAPMAFWGPDGSRSWSDGPVAMGHHMLHTTPESWEEELPRLDQRAGLAIVSDARIDNRAELFRALGVPSFVRPSMSDSALIVRAYERWGEECPSHLLGDFAFGIWDVHRRRLFCARDPMGRKPLFYHHDHVRFAFASAIKALLPLEGVAGEVNEDRVASFLLDVVPGPETFYSDVLRLLPAHTLTLSLHGVPSIRRYWFPEHVAELRLTSDAEYLDAFKEVFDRSVASRLRGTDPVGILLSGGLDSGSVALIAARELEAAGRDLQAFSAAPLREFSDHVDSSRTVDESSFIEEICRRARNIKGHIERSEGVSPLTDLAADFRLFDRPVRFVINRTWIYSLFEAARALGVKTMLSGQLGNLSISWDGLGTLAFLLKEGRWLTLTAELGRRWSIHPRQFWRTIKSQILLPLMPDPFSLRFRTWRDGEPPWYRYSLINREFADRLHVDERLEARRLIRYHGPRANPRQNQLDLLQVGCSEAGDVSAGLGGGFQMELRDPTADSRLIEFCLSLPPEQYVRHGRDRMLVRQAMVGIMPDRVLWNDRRGLQAADVLFRLRQNWNVLGAHMDRLERNDLAMKVLDLQRMRQVLGRLGSATFRKGARAEAASWLRANVVGQFLIWLDEK